MQILTSSSNVALFLVAVVFVSDRVFLASAGPASQEVEACDEQYLKTPNCPNYDAALACLRPIQTNGDAFDEMIKTYRLRYVKELKAKSCPYLTQRGTCMEVEYQKCTSQFMDLRADKHPDVCKVANKTWECVKPLEYQCANYPSFWTVRLDEVDKELEHCRKGHYTGSCSPKSVDACLTEVYKLPEGIQLEDYQHVCQQALVESADQCLNNIDQCTYTQRKYKDEKHAELLKCPTSA